MPRLLAILVLILVGASAMARDLERPLPGPPAFLGQAPPTPNRMLEAEPSGDNTHELNREVSGQTRTRDIVREIRLKKLRERGAEGDPQRGRWEWQWGQE